MMSPGIRRTCLAALLVAWTASAWAQTAAESSPFDPDLRSIDFGARINGTDGDEARFMRFEDLRSGGVLERARWTTENGTWLAHAAADNVGYRDQRYFASFERFGRIRASVEWNSIPFFLSETTRTAFSGIDGGVLRVPDELQAAIQAGGAPALATLWTADAVRYDIRSRRDIFTTGVTYQASRDLDVNVRLVSQARDGSQPFGAGFGMATPLEIIAPIDDRTTDLGTSVEWATRRALVRVGYDASFYGNSIDTLVWDNPVRLVDAPNASSQGRMPWWPDSSTHTVSATGSLALPARSRATGYVSLGAWSQDAALLPFTINSALSNPPLERDSVEGDAAVTSALVRFTSRPNGWAWLSASYRLYDFDNQTPPLHVPQQIKYDQAVQEATIPETEPLSFSRGLLELDGSFTPFRHGAIRVGYAREGVERTFRVFEQTTDHVLRLSYDVTSIGWMTLRAAYTRANRTGEGLDEEVLSDIGEQVSLRQFDISDRVRNQATLILTFFPSDMWSLNTSIGGGTEDRPDAQFGLTDTSFGTYGAGVAVTPREGLSFGADYGFESYDSFQRSRQANPGPQFEDPTRDWSTDHDERVHTLLLSADVLRAIPRTELRVGYDLSRSRARYIYGLFPGSTLPPPVQLPPIRNEWQRATLDARYALRSNLQAGLTYWYDRFEVDDFALNPSTMDRLVFGSTTLLGYFYRPYTANTVWLTLRYLW